LANALTGLRLALVLPFALAMAEWGAGAGLASAVLLVVAIATDLLDGRIARARGSESAAGRAFDHATDAFFVSAGLAAAALRGSLPLLLPVLVQVAFAQYVVDSYVLRRERALRMSALGRLNGILYFVPLALDCAARLLGSGFAPLASITAWLLVASTLASIGDRLLALKESRTAPGSPAAGT
jgi:phosphatidylglycerophosphate synthase